jgi:hypothetical protein
MARGNGPYLVALVRAESAFRAGSWSSQTERVKGRRRTGGLGRVTGVGGSSREVRSCSRASRGPLPGVALPLGGLTAAGDWWAVVQAPGRAVPPGPVRCSDGGFAVGEGGLEPPTACTQSRSATTAPLPGVLPPSRRTGRPPGYRQPSRPAGGVAAGLSVPNPRSGAFRRQGVFTRLRPEPRGGAVEVVSETGSEVTRALLRPAPVRGAACPEAWRTGHVPTGGWSPAGGSVGGRGARHRGREPCPSAVPEDGPRGRCSERGAAKNSEERGPPLGCDAPWVSAGSGSRRPRRSLGLTGFPGTPPPTAGPRVGSGPGGRQYTEAPV